MSLAVVELPNTHLCSCFHVTATTEIYTLSLHDALPISKVNDALATVRMEGYGVRYPGELSGGQQQRVALRSEEHTSELQSLRHLVCRLLLEKKNILTDKRLPKSQKRIATLCDWATVIAV